MERAPDWLQRQAYAHRGLHDKDIPENSLAAFEAAMAQGLGIECDLLPSADGRAIVFHDRELARLTGQQGLTRRTSIADLAALSLAGTDQRIPTLRDMLKSVAGRTPLLLELKSEKGEGVQKLCRAVRRDLEGYSGDVAVMSFDPRIPAWFASRLPALPRGLVVTEENARTLAGAVRRRLAIRHGKPQFLAYDIRDLPSRFAAAQNKRGLPILTWTVRSRAHVETALRCNATPILEGAGVAAWADEGNG